MAPTPVCAPAKLLPGGCCTAGAALSPAAAPLSQLVRIQRHYTASSSHQRRAMARRSSPKLAVHQPVTTTSPTTTTTPPQQQPPPSVPAATGDSAASRGASERVPRIVNGAAAAAAAAAEVAVAAGGANGVAVDDGDSGSVRGAVVASGGGPLRHHSPVSVKLPASAPTPPTALCDISGQLNCSWSTGGGGGGGGDAAVKKPHHHHTHLSNGQLDAASLLWLTENQFTTLSAAAAVAADGTNGIATAVAAAAPVIDGKKNGNICHRASDESLSQRSDNMHAIVDSYVRLSGQRPRSLSKFGADVIGDRCERSDWMAASGGDGKSAPDVSPIAAQHDAIREVCGSDQCNGAASPSVTVESSSCGGAGDGPAGGGSTTTVAADSKRCAGELVDGAGDVEMRESLGEGGDGVYRQLDTGTAVTTGSVSAECVLASQRVLRQRCGRLLRRLQLLQARAARQQYQCLVAGDSGDHHQQLQQPVAPLDCHSLLVARRQLLSLQRQLCPHDATDTSSSSDDSDSEPAGASLHHHQQQPLPAGYRDGDAVGDGGVTSRHSSRAMLARHWASSVQHVTEIDSRIEQLRALYKRMRSARGSWLVANTGDGDLAQCSRATAVAIVPPPPVPTSQSAATTAAVGGRRRWRRLVRVSRVLGQSAASGCQRCSTGPIGGAFFGATGGGGGGGVSQYGLCSCSHPAAGSNTAADSSCLRHLADASWRRQHLYPRPSVATAAASSSSCCSSTTTVSLPDTGYRLHSHSAGYSSAAAAAGSTAPPAAAAAPADSSCHPGSARQSGHVTRAVRGASWDDAADSADDVLSVSGVGAGGDERRRGGGDGGSSGGRGGRHSSTTSTASSRRHSSSYDIDMVLPPGLAVTGRIERLQYKDISTPGWRLVSSCGAAAAAAGRGSGCGGVGRLRSCPEDLSDAAFAGRHAVCQLAEQRRLYKRTIQRGQPLPPPPPQPLQTPQPSAYAPAVGAYTSLGSFSARHFPLSDADSRQLVAEEEEAEQMAPLFFRRRASSASGSLANAAACSSANDTFWPGLASEDGRSLSK